MKWSNRIAQGERAKRDRPHKEHGGTTADVLSGGRCFSCGHGSELIAHLASTSSQVFQSALLVDFFMVSKDAGIKGQLSGNESPNNSGQLWGHGGKSRGSSQSGA